MELKEAANAELLERLREGKMIQLAPQGISMLPFIQGGRDKVLVKKDERIDIGDIVLAPYKGLLILKGNEEVEKSMVWGKVVEIIKPNGQCRKPHKAWFWRHTLFIRRLMLKLRRKWYKMRGLNPE